MRPIITVHDAATGKTIEREMTDEEVAALVDSAYTVDGFSHDAD